MKGTVTGNTTTERPAGDGGGDGVDVTANGNSTVTALVQNNIQLYNDAGIRVFQRDGNGTLNATLLGNTISNPNGFALNGIRAQTGAVDTDQGSLCLRAGDPTTASLKNSIAGSGANGSTDVRVRQRFATTFRLPGYTGGATDTAAVVSFLQARNNGNGTPTGSATVEGPGFVNTAGGAPCPLP